MLCSCCLSHFSNRRGRPADASLQYWHASVSCQPGSGGAFALTSQQPLAIQVPSWLRLRCLPLACWKMRMDTVLVHTAHSFMLRLIPRRPSSFSLSTHKRRRGVLFLMKACWKTTRMLENHPHVAKPPACCRVSQPRWRWLARLGLGL